MVSQRRSLHGKTVLVTGAGTRLGAEIASGLAADGCDIVAHVHRSVAGGQETVTAVEAFGRRAALIQADLTREADLLRVAEADAWSLGALDGVVLSAAGFVKGRLADSDSALWRSVLRLNLETPVRLAHALGRRMAAGGRVVLIGDAAGRTPWPAYAVHSIAKGALETALPILAAELAPDVTVNLVAPGPVLLPDDYDAQAARRATARTILQRTGEPQDVVDAVRYLLTSPYVTGAILPVDGGRQYGGVALRAERAPDRDSM